LVSLYSTVKMMHGPIYISFIVFPVVNVKNLVKGFYTKTNQMKQFIKLILIYFEVALYMFRTVFPPIIRSLRLYRMELNFLPVPASKQSLNLIDIYLMLCIQS